MAVNQPHGGCRGKEFPLTSRYAPPDRPALSSLPCRSDPCGICRRSLWEYPFWLRCNGLGSPFPLKLPPLVARPASMVSHLPPCLNGYTFARCASMVSHLPAVPQWSHICPPCFNGLTSASMPPWSHISLHASMVSHLPAMPPWSHICPPCLNGYTFAAMPPWSHICRYASMVTHLPAMPQWSHICRRASMVTHLPAMPQWLHICRHASMVTQYPPHLTR